jgi:uncharacterized protein with NRDE domain
MPFIIAGNRDEFHGRPTQDAHWWPDMPETLAGRDQQAGGTWLGVGRNGRFAAITNFRDAEATSGKLRSRGHLIAEFLSGAHSSIDYLDHVDGDHYAGFNLLVSDGTDLGYLSNRGGGHQILPPGIYGVANATLDSPWTKVERSKMALSKLIESGRANETNLLHMLADRNKARVSEVEAGHLPFERAHALSAPFIVQPDYGTRCSTIVLRDKEGRFRFTEVRFSPDGRSSGRSDFSFRKKTDYPA